MYHYYPDFIEIHLTQTSLLMGFLYHEETQKICVYIVNFLFVSFKALKNLGYISIFYIYN